MDQRQQMIRFVSELCKEMGKTTGMSKQEVCKLLRHATYVVENSKDDS